MTYHLGDPCIHCGVAHDDVAPGPCDKAGGLAATMREIVHLGGLLDKHKIESELRAKELERLIGARRTLMNQAEAGLDPDKIALAETVLHVTDYARGGTDRASARSDAIKFLSTGVPLRGHYGDLRREYFGTKNYDRWSGQRNDCEYGYGPSHGSTVFSIGLKPDARKRDLTDAEREAAVYYLVNLERVQAARAEMAS